MEYYHFSLTACQQTCTVTGTKEAVPLRVPREGARQYARQETPRIWRPHIPQLLVKNLLYLLNLVLIINSLIACRPKSHEDEKLNGMSRDYIVSRFGPPSDTSVVMITKDCRLYEYQSGLSYLCDRRPDTLLVTEMTWHLEDEETLKIWLLMNDGRRYSVVDNVRWPKGVKF